MASDDVLTPAAFIRLLRESWELGSDTGLEEAYARLEAHDAALREQVRVLREALKSYSAAKSQCDCSPHSGCDVAEARAAARAALAATAQEEKP